ncbi:Ig-like domain (group 3) [Pseudarthrobacter equi]|uniref:Ig-like domain (Group 3) n=1 Tax=Pseudarthrobacter equi TaxID=728066 RepID=A0A1H2B3D0_9MICC|nr:Ig-like domain-containing protein [Pseudarthrobacter equi]SDT52459.1 Ig-like domain (group 3) [Pseudarthrobacter equi]
MSLATLIPALLRGRPSRKLTVVWVATALLLLLGTGSAAYAFWASTTSSSNAAAAADALTPGSKPAVSASGSSLSVTWAGGTTVNGRAATGYTVTRYAVASGGAGIPATGGCAGTVTTLSCTEQNVQGGIWYYTVTPAIALWTGVESPRSNGTSNDASAPVATVSGISPTPNTAGWNSSSPVTVSITAGDGASGSGVASISYAVDGGAQQTVGAAVASILVSGDGTHIVSYFATDKVGNAGTVQSQTVRIDTQAPAAPGLTVPAFANSANVAAVPVSGTTESGAKITLTAADTGAAHSATPVTATADGGGNWSATLNLSSLDQGAVAFSATATDAAGNVSAAKTASSVKETVAPAAAQSLGVPAYVNISTASSAQISGTAETGATVKISATSPGSAQPVTGTATAIGGNWSANLNLSSLRDGTVTYTVTVTDAAGNTGTAATATSTKDTVAPVLRLDTPPNILASTVTGYAVSGTSDSGSAVSVTVTDAATSIPATASGATWNTGPLNLSALKDTSSTAPVVALTITATTTDAAGNSTTVTSAVTKDTKAPTVDVTLQNAGGTLGKAEQGDTLTIQFSEAMESSKICSTWTNSAQTLSGNNNVVVNISTSNVLTVTSTSCTLNLGSITLGANAKYGSAGALSFNGNGNASNMSTVTWDGSTTLTIKLGKSTGGTSGTTTTPDVPVYTAGTGLTDAAGNALGTGPFNGTSSRF